MSEFDAIVIGSGFGGLTTASLLTQLAAQRVLVLEKHFKLGGFNHAFTRRGYRWDVGLHYVGQLTKDDVIGRVMGLVTQDRVEWAPMPVQFDTFHFPGFSFTQSVGREQFRRDLEERYPHERTAIRRYLHDLHKAATWHIVETLSWSLPAPISTGLRLANLAGRTTALMTTTEYVARNFTDLELRALLPAAWGDYGLPPGQSAFAQHALIMDHYLTGAWYPVGGADALTDAVVAIIEEGGGSVRPNHAVEEILIEDGRAVGVRVAVKKGRGGRVEEHRAPQIISAAGARTTFNRLIPEQYCSRERLLVNQALAGNGCVVAYLGLRDSPAVLGFDGGNHWYFDGVDHDTLDQDIGGGHPGLAYLSFPSMKDPAAPSHTAEIITMAPTRFFDQWAGTGWQRRGADYEEYKQRLGDGLIQAVQRRVPGFRDLIEHVEVSTPLTVTTFAGHPSGGFAELAGTPQRYRQKLFKSQVLPGLFLSAADVFSLGVPGTMMGGLIGAGSCLGPTGIARIMTRVLRRTPKPVLMPGEVYPRVEPIAATLRAARQQDDSRPDQDPEIDRTAAESGAVSG